MSVESRISSDPPPPSRDNGFGALRLLFAALVIVTHVVEQMYGSYARDPLYSLTGGMTLAALAVDGFFLISGYLIAASYASSPSQFFVKRVLRIYPAFLVCYVLCVLVVAPLGGADLAKLAPTDWARLGYRMLLLKQPEVAGVFQGAHYQALNGSMWTIAYEFRCYILAAALGAMGLYRRPRLLLVLLGFVLLAYVILANRLVVVPLPGWAVALIGLPDQTARLVATFLCGTAFWVLRVPLDARMAAACGLALVAFQFAPPAAEPAIMTLGAYVLFWTVFKVRWRPLRTTNARDDISYGVYLYAWPAAALLLHLVRGWTPVTLALATLLAAVICGAVSWRLIEKPALALKRPARRAAGADPAERPAPATGSL